MPSDRQTETKAGRLLRRIRLLEGRELVSEPELVSRLRRHYNDHAEPVETLRVFVVSNQQTWLVATGDALYCVIDKREQPEPKVVWRLPKDDIVENDRIKLAVDAFENPDSTTTGIFVINGQAPRKFTAGLFIRKTLKESIHDILQKVYVGAPGQQRAS